MPLAIAETSADVAELAALATAHGKQSLRPDAAVAAALAEAAAHSGAHLVEVNLSTIPGDDRSDARRRAGGGGAGGARPRPGGAVSPLPAWSLPAEAVDGIGIPVSWPEQVTRAWALEGSTGEGVDVCILDSGVEGAHPLVGGLASAVAVTLEGEETRIVPDELGDVCGHGTACAGIVRSLAPGCRLHSVRVLGAGNTGSGELILGGLRHAIEQGFHIVNLSLSTTKRRFAELLHELADNAYFQGTVLVASAHNMPVESYPWRFSSVDLGRQPRGARLAHLVREPEPAGRVLRAGASISTWPGPGGGTLRCTGNSFAAPHIAGLSALVLSKHPGLDPVPAEERPLPDRVEHRRCRMTDDAHYREAAAVGALASEEGHRALLQSIVDVARAIFGAKASSVFLLDEEADELVFEAVSGEGEEELVGMRFPSSTGIAGWVLVTRQPLVIDDLQQDPRFARQAAESTGYVPHGLMAVPLLIEERAIGSARGARPTQRHVLLARGDGPADAVRAPGGDRARPPAEGTPRTRGARPRPTAARLRWRGSPSSSSTRTTGSAGQLLDALEAILRDGDAGRTSDDERSAAVSTGFGASPLHRSRRPRSRCRPP